MLREGIRATPPKTGGALPGTQASHSDRWTRKRRIRQTGAQNVGKSRNTPGPCFSSPREEAGEGRQRDCAPLRRPQPVRKPSPPFSAPLCPSPPQASYSLAPSSWAHLKLTFKEELIHHPPSSASGSPSQGGRPRPTRCAHLRTGNSLLISSPSSLCTPN